MIRETPHIFFENIWGQDRSQGAQGKSSTHKQWRLERVILAAHDDDDPGANNISRWARFSSLYETRHSHSDTVPTCFPRFDTRLNLFCNCEFLHILQKKEIRWSYFSLLYWMIIIVYAIYIIWWSWYYCYVYCWSGDTYHIHT